MGRAFSADNVYSRYTLSRFEHDPYAKWQHPAMFAEPDKRARELDKDPGGSWIVAPIVKKSWGGMQLMGFISADMHVPEKGRPKDTRSDDPREIALQCRALDVVSDLAHYILPGIAAGAVSSPRPARPAHKKGKAG